MMKAAIMGYGTIGSGVFEMLLENREQVAKKAGEPIEVKYVLDLREFPGTPAEGKTVQDIAVIEEDPEISIVVETMGGTTPAYDFVKRGLMKGKHVVTSNKALVAAHGTELLKLAEEKQVNFLFEASVGGGIPIIRTLNDSLAGEDILEISGIMNGTTNYVLSKMYEEGWTFEAALEKARELGYAERDPRSDVEGYDTCRKIAILTAVAAGKEVCYEDVPTRGITDITDLDFSYAARLGMSIKLLGISRKQNGNIYAEVAPVMIGPQNPLYSVSGVYNGIMVTGNMLGVSMFYGSGAGKLPTASAVVADMIQAALHGNGNRMPGWTEEKQEILPADLLERHYFARFEGNRRDKKELVEEAFGSVKWISLEGLDEFAILTGKMSGPQFREAAGLLGGLRQSITAEL